MTPQQFHEQPARSRREWWKQEGPWLWRAVAAVACLVIGAARPMIIPDLLHWIGALR